MDKVKRLLEAGLSLSDAIKVALGVPVGVFAKRHRRPRTRISAVINGSLQPNADDLAALATELGGTPEEWRALLRERTPAEESTAGRNPRPPATASAATRAIA